MDLISLPFAGFFLITLVIYHVLPGRWRKAWLLATSIFFYGLLDIRYLLVLVLLTVSNYWFVKKLSGSKKAYDVYFGLALFLNLSAFVCLKVLTSRYAGLIYPAVNDLTSKWLLPVGFSFYILQLISLHLSIRNGQVTKVPGFFDFALYLAYFPKITSGPIEKTRLFFDKLTKLPALEIFDFSHGLGLILTGLIRKMFIVKILYFFIPNWLADTDKIGWVQVITFTLLVYNDFAGYTSIVRGLSCLFGLDLSENFQQPLFARNFSEFWNRWHITLSTWLRETIYFPLSRKLGKNPHLPVMAVILPPLATMLASGFWHGASLSMIVWGLINSFYLIIERLLYEKFPKLRPQNLSEPFQLISRIVVLILFAFSMVPFAVTTFKPSLTIWKNFIIQPLNGINSITPVFVAVIVFSFLLDGIAEYEKNANKSQKWNPVLRSVCIALGIIIFVVGVLLNFQTNGSVFIYQDF